MPYIKQKRGDEWVVTKKDNDEVLGTHDSESKANKQLSALYANVDDVKESESWKKIEHYVYNHPIYKELPKDELEECVAAIFEKYAEDDLELLQEYTDLFMLSGGGWGPNSSGLSYSNAGYGRSGGSTYGYGGTGVARLGGRQGTRVYGFDNINGLTPGQGVAPIGSKDGEPAVVMVPKKKSNYKPWETELTPSGYRKKDIDRNQAKQERDETWFGPFGDVLRALEAHGHDVHELNDMTQEEIEDLIIRTLKKEQQEEKLEEQRNILSDISDKKQLVLEAFSIDDEDLELLDEKKRQSKIQDARNLLAKKHSKKEALEKNEGGRAYIIDRYGIEKLMRKYGYVYDEKTKKWVKKTETPDHKTPDMPKPSPVGGVDMEDPVEDSVEDDDTTTQPQLTQSPTPSPTEPTETGQSIDIDPTKIDRHTNILVEPGIQNLAKDRQARYILALAYDMDNAVDFVQDTLDRESQQEIPVIPTEQILVEMEHRNYTWDNYKNVWLDETVSLPNKLFEVGDKKASTIARSFLSAMGDNTFIQINKETKTPLRTADEAEDALLAKGYNWNVDIGKWEYTGVKLTEATNRTAAERRNPLKHDYGFNAVDAQNMNARYALKAEQIMDVKKGINPSKFTDNKDPTAYHSYPNISRPMMSDKNVSRSLQDKNYKVFKNGQMRYWSTRQNTVPDAVKNLSNDEIETYIGRSILAANDTKTGAKYITFDGDIEGSPEQENFEPSIEADEVESRMEQTGFTWDNKRGWFQRSSITGLDFDEEDLDLDSDKITSFKDESDILRKFDGSDWELMSYSDRELYKETLANRVARKTLGISKNDWPSGNDPISKRKRQNYRNKMGIHYRFDPKTKQYVKRDRPVLASGDYIDLKSGIGNAMRATQKTLPAMGGILGNALKALSLMTY